MIKLQIIGNLGKDAIVNNVNGKTVINFAAAHTEKFKDSTGTPKEKTTWVDCAYWTDRTAIAPYLKKGTTIFAEGIPDINTYTTNDGRSGSKFTLRVNNIQLIGGKPSEGNSNFQQGSPISQAVENTVTSNANSTTSEPLDDLPF